jgi:hypothetical protein
MREPPGLALRAVIGFFALVGLAGVLPVSMAELTTGSACPHLGPVPACHLVSIAYAAVLISVLHSRLWKPSLFLLAWSPIFLLAATGSGLELTGHGTCPKTSGEIPKCFFSLGLAVALIVPFLIHFAQTRRSNAENTVT